VIRGLSLGVFRQALFPSCWRTWYLGPNFGGQNQTKPFLGFGGLFLRSLGVNFIDLSEHRSEVFNNVLLADNAVF